MKFFTENSSSLEELQKNANKDDTLLGYLLLHTHKGIELMGREHWGKEEKTDRKN